MIKIVTDSTVYIKKNDADTFGIRVVPATYVVDGKLFSESFSDDNGNFEELIEKNDKITTSHPNLSAFITAFEEEKDLGNDVLCITISSRLSSTYSSAVIAAEQVGNGRIHVFDSRLTAGGQYLLVCEARKLIDNGEKTADIMDKLTKIRDRISIVFSVDDMKPLRNSGRIGFVRMSIGTILNIKPILLCKDGIVVSDSVARGTNETIKKFVDKIPVNSPYVIVNYISNKRMASILYNVIKIKCPNTIIKLNKMGPVLGVHLGLYVVGVSYIAS